jgi:UDP-glucose 4-epimerase
MKKVLITGGAGFIGSHLVEKLIKNNFNIMVVDNLSLRKKYAFINKSLNFIKGDYQNEFILKKIHNFKPEIIFHLAAQSSSEPAYDNPKEDLLNNGYGTYLLCKLAVKINVKLFVYASSVAIYGSKSYGKLYEDDLPKPDSIYGISKYLGELYIQSVFKNQKTKFLIFRISNTYGPGEDLSNLRKGMMSIYSSYIWKNKTILVKGSLARFRNFTYISDVIDFIYKSIFQKKLNMIYNLSSGEKYTVKKLIENLLLRFGMKKKCPYKVIKGTPGDSYGLHLSNKKIIKDFKMRFNYDLNKGLNLYIKWIKNLSK